MQVCRSESMQLCIHKGTQVCRHSGMLVWSYGGMGEIKYRYSSIKVFNYPSIQVWYSGMVICNWPRIIANCIEYIYNVFWLTVFFVFGKGQCVFWGNW